MKSLAAVVAALLLSASSNGEAVGLHCWIVGDDDGRTSYSAGSVQDVVDGANQIFAQVALSFEVRSLSFTNDTRLSDLDYSDAAQKNALCGVTNATGGLELYFIRHLEGIPTAFSRRDGIVIGHRANVRTVAHEIGHACGLKDIYDRASGAEAAVDGAPSRDRMPLDWGWYPPDTTHADVLKRLLMYGYASEAKADISLGDVYGLYYTSAWNPVSQGYDRTWHLGPAPVGFEANGVRSPASE